MLFCLVPRKEPALPTVGGRWCTEVPVLQGLHCDLGFVLRANEEVRDNAGLDLLGQVVETYTPRQGETTRDLMIRLMNGDVD